MKNTLIAEKMKLLRQRAGLSQDALAATAGINLRTIQRIESGDTTPRGDTLTRLAKALNVSPADFISVEASRDNSKLIYLNLSALSVVLFPVIGLLLPLIVFFVLRKHKDKNLDEFKNALLNFQLTICILNVVAFIALSALPVNAAAIGKPELIIISLYMFALVNALMIIVNTFMLLYNKKVFYPAIPILR